MKNFRCDLQTLFVLLVSFAAAPSARADEPAASPSAAPSAIPSPNPSGAPSADIRSRALFVGVGGAVVGHQGQVVTGTESHGEGSVRYQDLRVRGHLMTDTLVLSHVGGGSASVNGNTGTGMGYAPPPIEGAVIAASVAGRYGIGASTGELGIVPCRLYALGTASGEIGVTRFIPSNPPAFGGSGGPASPAPVGSFRTSVGGEGGFLCTSNGLVIRAGAGGGGFVDESWAGGRAGAEVVARLSANFYDALFVEAEHRHESDGHSTTASVRAVPLRQQGIPVFIGADFTYSSVSTDAMKAYANQAQVVGIPGVQPDATDYRVGGVAGVVF